MLLLLLIIFLIILCLIERELDRHDDAAENIRESCHKCGTEITADTLICPDCGSLVREHCSDCGRSKVVAHQFCPWCGVNSNHSRSQYAA